MKKNPIRVAMIIQSYHPHVGGAEKQLAALAPLLKAQGVELHILTRRYADWHSFEMINDVPVHRLPIPGPKPIAALSFSLAALPLLRKLRPHVIHAHELLSPTTTAVLAKRLFGVPVVAKVLRGGVLGDLAKLKKGTLGSRRIEQFRQQVNAFITISQEIDAELAEIGIPPEARPFIPNGVDIDRFAPLSISEKQSLRTELNLPGDGTITAFTGRLAVEKRLDQLISIWPAVRATQPEAKLMLVGTGPDEAKLKEAAGAGVLFVGRVDDVAPYLKAADLFVLPSATEGLSNALLEAMAAGLPAIATLVGGAPDVIDHKRSGWLIPADTPTALQEAVLTLLNDPVQLAELGRCGREKVSRDYALSTIAGKLRGLYDQVLAKPVVG